MIQLSNNINSRNIGDNNNVSNRKSTRKGIISPEHPDLLKIEDSYKREHSNYCT